MVHEDMRLVNCTVITAWWHHQQVSHMETRILRASQDSLGRLVPWALQLCGSEGEAERQNFRMASWQWLFSTDHRSCPVQLQQAIHTKVINVEIRAQSYFIHHNWVYKAKKKTNKYDYYPTTPPPLRVGTYWDIGSTNSVHWSLSLQAALGDGNLTSPW